MSSPLVSWVCGGGKMSPTQSRLYSTAWEQINHNVSLLRPGLEFREFNEKSWRIPDKHQAFRYTVAMHATGMCDEVPFVPLHPEWGSGIPGCLEENMVMNVESLIAEEGTESVKLETQVLVTKHGAQRLDTFPWEL